MILPERKDLKIKGEKKSPPGFQQLLQDEPHPPAAGARFDVNLNPDPPSDSIKSTLIGFA
jgi:hypothetical protein